jgi:hypothetical protein
LAPEAAGAGTVQSKKRIATGRTVRGSNPGGGENFRTGPGAHPASDTMDTGSFQGVKRTVRGFDHPPPSSAEVKERVELYLYCPAECSWLVLG